MPDDRTKAVSRIVGAPSLWALSILVGVVAGLGAIVFRGLIGLFHNLLFLGRLSVNYDANTHTPASPWGAAIVLVPVVGAMGVAFLVKNFAPEAKGHGVPEVMDAVYHHRGIIRPVVSVVKAFASAISIGSGGSIGREGPIIQIGSSFGSTLSQLLKLPAWQRITLLAAGAGGGIAATFNTPIGGVLFAIEIIVYEVSPRTVIPIVLGTATAAYVGQLSFGPHPSFFIPALETPALDVTNFGVLLAYAALGVVAGLVSAVFIWSIYAFESFFEKRVKGGYYVQHGIGMLIVGLLMLLFMSAFGHYYIEGVGYATIQDILSGLSFPVYLFVVLFAGKLLATSLTLGSGASGGVFSPALFLGATSGGLCGLAVSHLFPGLGVSPAAFAVAGMGAVVAGSVGAPMAAIVMIFEMTRDYRVVLPMTMTVAVSYAVRRSLMRDSIYTRKLTLRGESAPEAMRADVQLDRRTRDIMHPASPEAVAMFKKGCGGETGNNCLVVPEDMNLWDLVAELKASGANIALVARSPADQEPSELLGQITGKDILDVMAEGMELFG